MAVIMVLDSFVRGTPLHLPSAEGIVRACECLAADPECQRAPDTRPCHREHGEIVPEKCRFLTRAPAIDRILIRVTVPNSGPSAGKLPTGPPEIITWACTEAAAHCRQKNNAKASPARYGIDRQISALIDEFDCGERALALHEISNHPVQSAVISSIPSSAPWSVGGC